MKEDLASIKRFAQDLSRHGVRHMLQRYAEINRPYVPRALVVDALAIGAVWYAWGRHGDPMGIPLIAVAIGLFIVGNFVAASGFSMGGGGGAPLGGGAPGHHPREYMDSNEEWSRALHEQQQSQKPTANVLFIATLPALLIGLALLGLGL